MADCGATGSALDRSAARIFSATLGNQNNGGQNAARAGKAISSFLGGVATTGSNLNAPGALMPSAVPTSIGHMNMAVNHGTTVDQNAVPGARPMEHAHRMVQPSMNANANMNATQRSINTSMPMAMGGQMNMMNPQHQYHPQAHVQMQQANMQMQMQMNMMQQQMAMAQMAQQQQQQQHHQQQQQQKLQQQEKQRQIEPQNQSQSLGKEIQEAEQATKGNAVDDWHKDLEDEFQNYLNSYKSETGVESTTGDEKFVDYDDDGNVQGVSVERLAAAWEEAEKQFTQDDYSNLATDGNELYENRLSQHVHYEYSTESELYGKVQGDEEKYIDLMSEGMKHFQEGDTSEAILCFESEVRNVDGNNADAWLMLGKCHAENDQDRKAITCLENAVERDPFSTEALLALGVSYVNELDYERAYKNLNNWLTHNPNYAGLEMMSTAPNSGQEGALYQLKSLLKQAKEYDEVNGSIENSVDVLEALGVVCNVTREFDEAVESFRTASTLRPDGYQLFNKLGATLANSNRSDEAQDAYQSALAIKPKYARAWLNMAISHSNLHNHEEAARCYLQALSLNRGAVHVWSYLRIALTCSEKWDLLPLAASQDLDAFQQHYDFI
jgi:peroxin-5